MAQQAEPRRSRGRRAAPASVTLTPEPQRTELHGRRAGREDRARLDRIFQHAPIGIQEIGPDGRYRRVNPAFCRMLGYEEREVIGRRAGEVGLHADAAESGRRLRELLASGQGAIRFRRHYLRKDGGLVHAQLTASVVPGEDGEGPSLIVLVEDVSEQQRVREDEARLLRELQEANRRQQELSRLRRNMTAAIAHEMRTPLTVLLGFADLLLEGIDGELTAGQRDAVQAMRDATLQEVGLLEDARAIAEVRSDPTALHLERVDLVRLVARATDRFAARAAEKGLELRTEYVPPPVAVMADADQLGRAMVHLLSNAVKFTHRGGVLVRCAVEGRRALVEVRDTGIGIPPDDLARIFEDFHQLDQGSTRRYAGLGLGLTLVRTVVVAHRGEVAVESEPGTGSSFTITLPLAGD